MFNYANTINKIYSLNMSGIEPSKLVTEDIISSNFKKNIDEFKRNNKNYKSNRKIAEMLNSFVPPKINDKGEKVEYYTAQTINNLTSNKKDIRLRDIYCFCKLMKITPEKLLFDVEPEDFFCYVTFALPLSHRAYKNLRNLYDYKLIINNLDLNHISIITIIQTLIMYANEFKDNKNYFSIKQTINKDYINKFSNAIAENTHTISKLDDDFYLELNCKNPKSNLINDYEMIYNNEKIIDSTLNYSYVDYQFFYKHIIEIFFTFDKENLYTKNILNAKNINLSCNNKHKYDLDFLSISKNLNNILINDFNSSVKKFNETLKLKDNESLYLRKFNNIKCDDEESILELDLCFKKFNPNVDYLISLAKKLNISLTELLYKHNNDYEFEYKNPIMDSFIDNQLLFNFFGYPISNLFTGNKFINKFIEHPKFENLVFSHLSFTLINFYYVYILKLYGDHTEMYIDFNNKFITEEEAEYIDSYFYKLNHKYNDILKESKLEIIHHKDFSSFERYSMLQKNFFDLFYEIVNSCSK